VGFRIRRLGSKTESLVLYRLDLPSEGHDNINVEISKFQTDLFQVSKLIHTFFIL